MVLKHHKQIREGYVRILMFLSVLFLAYQNDQYAGEADSAYLLSAVCSLIRRLSALVWPFMKYYDTFLLILSVRRTQKTSTGGHLDSPQLSTS